jgi:glycosyltransferase involved in cell wall biosynthesis
MKNRKGIIILTTGMSLRKWQQLGIFSREIKYYHELSKISLPLTFISYSEDLIDEKSLLEDYENLDVIAVKRIFSNYKFKDLFSSIFPIIFLNFNFTPVFVRTNQFNGSWAGLILKLRYKIPLITRCGYIYSEHFSNTNKIIFKNYFVRLIEKLILKNSNHIIVTYSYARDLFVKNYNINKNKITIIGNSIDTNLFKHNNSEKKFDIITIAKHTEQKNLINLCRAIISTNYSLLIIGKSNATITNKLIELNNGNIFFKENINNSDLPELLNSAKIFILPSLYEGNPKALLEAMSCGLPCIVSNIKEHKEFIIDEFNGLFCNLDDSSIKSSIKKLYNDSNLKEKLSINARKTILNRYSLNTNAKIEKNIIQNTI